ncbi:cache domain-containing protein [Azorhizobium sp. AG788]|uniref:cache domain-containing protein n=1 Tax=Azorhizobium sp. AG788 TaxID=2183897 RepID=UPI0031397131
MSDRPRASYSADAPPPSRWRIGVVIVAACAGLALVGTAVWQDRRGELARAHGLAASQVAALGGHAIALVDGLELALDKVEAEIHGRPLPEVRADAVLYKQLTALQAKFPQIESIFAVDAQGRALVSSRAFPVPPYDERDRDYYAAAKAGHSGLYVSQPYRAQAARDVSFVLSRPMMENGRFAGLVAVSVAPPALQAFYGTVLGNAGGGAVLARADGVVLLRSLSGPKWPDRLPERSDLMTAAGQQETGVFSGTSLVEGERVLYAFQALGERELLVALAVTERDALAPWYRRTLLFGGGTLLAFCGLLAWAFPRRGRPPAGPRSWLPPLVPWRSSRDRRADAGGKSLSPSAVRVLDALAGEVGGRLGAQDPAAAAPAAALIQALLRFAAGSAPQPQLIDIAGSLAGLPDLLASAGRPTFQFPEIRADEPVLVFVDPAQLALALLDCALSLAAADPMAHVLDVQAEVLSMSASEVDGLAAGTYVCVTLAAAGTPAADRAPPAFPSGTAKEGAALFGLAAAYAPDLRGVAVAIAPAGGRGPVAQLWLPESFAEPAAVPSSPV